MIYPIRNPALRFLAGLVVFGLVVAAIVVVLYSVGHSMEPMYAKTYPLLYREWGYRFIDQVFVGLITALITFIAVCVLVVVGRCVRWLGNTFFAS